MSKWLLWPLVALTVVVVLALLATAWGAILPANHRATRTATYAQPPAAVWAVIADLPGQSRWRPDVPKIERLADRNGHEVWWEGVGKSGVPFETLESQPPTRLVRRIVDDGLPFGGTWTMVLTPEGAGTRLAITEDGVVRNPFFRFVSHVVLGTTRTMDIYLRNLGKHFGEEVTPR